MVSFLNRTKQKKQLEIGYKLQIKGVQYTQANAMLHPMHTSLDFFGFPTMAQLQVFLSPDYLCVMSPYICTIIVLI